MKEHERQKNLKTKNAIQMAITYLEEKKSKLYEYCRYEMIAKYEKDIAMIHKLCKTSSTPSHNSMIGFSLCMLITNKLIGYPFILKVKLVNYLDIDWNFGTYKNLLQIIVTNNVDLIECIFLLLPGWFYEELPNCQYKDEAQAVFKKYQNSGLTFRGNFIQFLFINLYFYTFLIKNVHFYTYMYRNVNILFKW